MFYFGNKVNWSDSLWCDWILAFQIIVYTFPKSFSYFLFLILFIYVFGCARSFDARAFLQLQCRLLIAVAFTVEHGLQGAQASVVAARKFSNCEFGTHSCGATGLAALEAHGIFPDQGLNLCLLALSWILTTEPTGKPLLLSLIFNCSEIVKKVSYHYFI